MVLQLYLISVLLFTLTILYLMIQIRRDTNLFDKAMLILKNPDDGHNRKYPFVIGFIPVINICVALFFWWFIFTDIENVRKFLNNGIR